MWTLVLFASLPALFTCVRLQDSVAAPGTGSKNSSVVFAITTSKRYPHVLNHRACLETWAGNISRKQLLVIGGMPISDKRAIYVAADNCADTHFGGACKDSMAIAKAAELKADWLVLVGDDNYVFTSNVKEELENHDPSVPVIFGIIGCGSEKCSIGGLCGGGGQIFSRAMLQRMLSPSRMSFLEEHWVASLHSGLWGDVASCTVASHHGGTIDGSLLGFHGWNMDAEERSAAITAVDPKPLTFHYMDHQTMHLVHNEMLWAKLSSSAVTNPSVTSVHETRSYSKTFTSRQEKYVVEERHRRELKEGLKTPN
jgi:hypothetical protein